MKNHEVWAFCRRGYVNLEATGSFSSTIDLNHLRIPHTSRVLLRDYISQLQVLANEFDKTHEHGCLWVPTVEFTSPLITVKTILVVPPSERSDLGISNAEASSLSNCISPNAAEHETYDAEAADIRSAPIDPDTESPNDHEIAVDNNENIVPPEHGNAVPAMPILNTNQPINANPVQANDPTLVDRPEYYEQLGLGLYRNYTPDERNASLKSAHNILSSYYNGDITSFQQVDNLIETSPIPEITRNTVFYASSKWPPLVTTDGVLHWPTPGGIKHKLPFEDSVGLIVKVHGLEELDGQPLSSRVSIIRIPKKSNVALVNDSTRKSDRTLLVDIVNADLLALLSLSLSLNVSLNVAASVSKSIKSLGDASFTIISAFSLDRNEDYDEKPRNLTEALFQRPDNLSLWSAD